MSATFGQEIGLTETAAATTLAATGISTTAGSLLVLNASLYTGATQHVSGITDSAGNTWTKIQSNYHSGSNSEGEQWVCLDAAAITSITVTFTASLGACASLVEILANGGTFALDQIVNACATGASPSSGATPALTGSGEIAVGCIAYHNSATASTITTSGYTSTTFHESAVSSAITTILSAYDLSVGPGAQTLTGTGPSAYYFAGLATFIWTSGVVPVYAGPVQPVSASGLASNSAITSYVVTAPASIVSGNLLLAFAFYGATSAAYTWSAPSGWSSLASNYPGTDAGGTAIFYKYATGSEPSTYTFTLSTAFYGSVLILQYNNIQPSSSFDGSAAFYNGSSLGASYPAPSVTATYSNETLITFYASYDGVSVSSGPSGMTQREIATASAVIGVAYDEVVPSGATGTETLTFSSSYYGMAASVLLLPGPSWPPARPLLVNQAVQRAAVW